MLAFWRLSGNSEPTMPMSSRYRARSLGWCPAANSMPYMAGFTSWPRWANDRSRYGSSLLLVQDGLDVGVGPGKALEVHDLDEGAIHPELVHGQEQHGSHQECRWCQESLPKPPGEPGDPCGEKDGDEGAGGHERPEGLQGLELPRRDVPVDHRRPE